MSSNSNPITPSLAALATFLVACQPELSFRPGSAPPRDELDDPGISLAIEPPAPLDHAPPVLRLHLRSRAGEIDPERVALITGKITASQLRQIEKDQISKSLSQRIVPSLVFPDQNDPLSLVLAPLAPLTPGATFSLASGDPNDSVEITIATDDPLPLLERVWPPEGASATARFGLFCTDTSLPLLPLIDEPTQLAPSRLPGRLRSGTFDGDPISNCLRFQAEPNTFADDAPALPPPTLGHPEPLARLDPRPFVEDAPHAPLPPLACADDELAFGPGCARLADDRLYARSPGAPLLWAIRTAALAWTFAASPAEPFTLTGLTPSTPFTLDIAAIDDRGELHRDLFSATTLPPMPHIVLNEVLANPIGPEPHQEWVEIVNDGPLPAELQGYALIDVGGQTLLPSATLAPGAMALIVNETYLEDDGYDPAPPPETLLLRVPKLGLGGLSNEGEPLKLLDPDGAVVSRFPPSPKPKAGMSLARRTPSSPDGLASAFLTAQPTPGQTNTF